MEPTRSLVLSSLRLEVPAAVVNTWRGVKNSRSATRLIPLIRSVRLTSSLMWVFSNIVFGIMELL